MSNIYEANSKGLFKDGKPIVPEFGNKEQIDAVRKFEKRMEALTGTGLVYQPEYTFKVNVKCVCGNTISYEEDIPQEDYADDFEPSGRAKCYSCKSEYSFGFDHEEQEHLIHLLEKSEEEL